MTLTRRYIARGRLLDDFAKRYINKTTGAIAWQQCGAWILDAPTGESTLVTSITYRPRAEKYDISTKGWHIDQEWVISNNWHDYAAFTERDIAKVVFADKVGSNLGLAEEFCCESSNSAAKAVADELETTHKTNESFIVPVDPTMVTVKKRKKAPGDASATPLALTSA